MGTYKGGHRPDEDGDGDDDGDNGDNDDNVDYGEILVDYDEGVGCGRDDDDGDGGGEGGGGGGDNGGAEGKVEADEGWEPGMHAPPRPAPAPGEMAAQGRPGPENF